MRELARHPTTVAFGGFLALAVALGIGRFVYTPILPYMAAGLDFSRSDAGLIASANYLGYLAGALLVSLAGLPGSRRAWLLSGLVLSGVSTAAMAAYETMLPFLLLRFAGGIAGAVVMVYASALVMDRRASTDRAPLASVLYAGVGGGIAVSAVLVPVVATGPGDWQPLWMASGGIAILLLIPAVWLLADDRADEEKAPEARFVTTAPSAFWRWVLAYGLVGFGYVITATFIADLVRSSPSLRPAEPAIWLVVGVSAIPSVAFWTWFGRVYSTRSAFAVASVCQALGVALSVLSESIAVLVAAAALLGGTVMGLTALGLIEVTRLSAADPRRGLAIMTVAFGAGQMTGPVLAGVLHDALGSYLVPSLCAAAGLLVGAVATGTLPGDGDRLSGRKQTK